MPAARIILCADDFGISVGVNRAIVDLVAQGRLSAVSCMSLAPAWKDGAAALTPLRDSIDVGLHITLTGLPSLMTGRRQPSEKEVIVRSWLRLLNVAALEAEVRAQFDRFIAVWGAPPDFIDGHQHVHVLPVIRDIVLRLRAAYAPQAWVRNPCDATAQTEGPKHRILNILGRRMKNSLVKKSIPHNALFRGAYDYGRPADYAALMAHWCAVEGPVLIYCHPGFPDAGLAQVDRLLEPRRREYDFLASARFGAWLAEAVTLQRRP